MEQINYTATAQKLSVKVLITGILNATARIEYDETDQVTILWGPNPVVNGEEYPLEKNVNETASQQNGRSTYILGNLRNYTDSPIEASIVVEFYQTANGVQTLVKSSTLFSGTVAANSEKKPGQVYMLTLNNNPV